MAAGKDLKAKLDGDTLDLSFSGLNTVPVREIAALKKVTKLDLSSNTIASLPDDFCTLKNLVEIDLSSNKLCSLPENLGKLENLQRLDLYKNALKTLPHSFANLKQLRWLDVKDNPLDEPLRKLAGDCLDVKQCREAATKVVQHMQKISSDREREKQKELKKQREVEVAEKAKEDEAKNAKAAEKKKEKEKKKQGNNGKGANNQENEVKETTKESEKKRAAQREKGSTKQEQKAKATRGCCSRLCGCLYYILKLIIKLAVILSLLAVIVPMVVYYNCSRPAGKEFIPKSRDLCQDAYQMVQAGRLLPLTWDYRATAYESANAFNNWISGLAISVSHYDYVGWKNWIVETALSMRDIIVSFSIWAYENGSKVAMPMLKQMAEWFWVALAITFWLLERALHYLSHLVNWIIEGAMDIFNNFPVYWENVKFYWKNMK